MLQLATGALCLLCAPRLPLVRVGKTKVMYPKEATLHLLPYDDANPSSLEDVLSVEEVEDEATYFVRDDEDNKVF